MSTIHEKESGVTTSEKKPIRRLLSLLLPYKTTLFGAMLAMIVTASTSSLIALLVGRLTDQGFYEKDATAKEAFSDIRESFEIEESVSDSQALKIMAIRTEINSMGYKKYMPATIASDVSDETIMEVEENSSDLPGVDVVSESKRYYPNGELA